MGQSPTVPGAANNTTQYNIMKVLLAVAVAFVAAATLPSAIEACGEYTKTACELIEMALDHDQNRRPSQEKAAMMIASVRATGCAPPQRSSNRQAMGQSI